MRGNNTMMLNAATVMEALQEYFDKRISPKIKVESVTMATTNQTPEFTVRVSEVVEK